MIPRILSMALLLFTPLSFANTFVHGTVWPVKERNMAELLAQRASRLSTKEIQSQWQRGAQQYYDRPSGIAYPRATITTYHEYVPIAHAYQDITDNDGQLIASAGSSINVLQRMPFYHPELYFLNADDPAQLKYASHVATTPDTKFILVSGRIMDAERALQQRVYFDQAGKLSSLLGITQLPAHVYRQGDGLQVHQVMIKEGV